MLVAIERQYSMKVGLGRKRQFIHHRDKEGTESKRHAPQPHIP